MKWIKHIVESGDDPDIQESVVLFGHTGYYVFFRTLEVMAREFKIHTPGFNNFLLKVFTKKFQNSAKKTLKVLKFYRKKKRIFFKIRGEGVNQRILLNCPKLRVLCDEYTQKILKKKSGYSPDTNRDLLRPIEIEAEVEVKEKLIKKDEPYRLPFKEEITESSIPKVKSEIEKACKDLYERGIFPQANAFANKCLKIKSNPRAILHTLTRVSNAKPKVPWAYAVKIMKVEDGNFNERDFRKTT